MRELAIEKLTREKKTAKYDKYAEVMKDGTSGAFGGIDGRESAL